MFIVAEHYTYQHMQCIVVLLNVPMYTTLSTTKHSERLYLVIVDSTHVSYSPSKTCTEEHYPRCFGGDQQWPPLNSVKGYQERELHIPIS